MLNQQILIYCETPWQTMKLAIQRMNLLYFLYQIISFHWFFYIKEHSSWLITTFSYFIVVSSRFWKFNFDEDIQKQIDNFCQPNFHRKSCFSVISQKLGQIRNKRFDNYVIRKLYELTEYQFWNEDIEFEHLKATSLFEL